MRLKRLELQGFKTFAQRTEFIFDAGITAIVGPNGSGKSNLADAIRWVLGEQSYTLLRARRTEDMIFAGSQHRARQGMAQVTLVLDNSDGWLPLEFSEVSITRRAYRSGENEYLLNGNRVRLRDIQELLASSGLARRTYTVIGQGLVDQALALRPEERRLLFEEAAGITAHRAKRDEALRRLSETKANLVRVQDLLNEMAPRLRSLERQARRAEEWQQVRTDLEAALRVWYGYQWRRALQRVEQSRAAEEQAAAVLAQQQKALAEAESHLVDLRRRQAALRERLGDWHRESSDLHQRAEQVQRQLAVSSERYRLLGVQLEELTEEVTALRERAATQAQQVVQAEEALARARERAEETARAAQEAQQAAEAEEAERRLRQQTVERARSDLVRAEAAMEDVRRRIAEVTERAQASAQERAQQEAQLVQAREKEARLETALHQAKAELETLDERLEAAQKALRAAREAVDRARQEEREAAAGLAEAQRRLDRLQTRLELLERLREEGAGLYAGVRTVIQAVRRPRPLLTGIVGTVGELLHVPPELERAIETALGGRLQDVVVERWEDAEAAIAYLKRTRGGRATFLPLDTIRPPRPVQPVRMPGVLGLASELVTADARLRDVVRMLLGRTLVVENLQTARRVFAEADAGVQVVTLDGDIVRPGGSVTGGREDKRRHDSVLARERERRELPAEIEAARRAVAEAQRRLTRCQEAQRQAESEVAAREQALRELRERREALQRQVQEHQRGLDSARQAVRWHESLLTQAKAQADAAAQEVAQLQERLAALEAARAERADALTRAEAALQAVVDRAAAARAAEARAVAATAEAEWRSQEAVLRRAREALAQAEAEQQARERRLAGLKEERERLAGELAVLRQEAAALQGQIDRLAEQIAPTEAEVERLEAAQAEAEAQELRLRQQLRQAEEAYHQAQLALERARDELKRLRREIEHELGLVALESGEGGVDQPPLPLAPLVESLPVISAPPEGLERDIRRLRAQLSRLGRVNPDAPTEYAEMLERHAFLSEQLTDLNDAVAGLQQVIAELNELMDRDFKRTFEEVAKRFRAHFRRLFGGGTARLVLTDPENLSTTGVEIVAHLPGKRAQSLALLSGGERSLTAAALIFALLEVNPPPFCILDEVDAALDEANVGRFRETLKELSAHTQFIVITHNRGTVEIADTIYGISMGADGVSQVLSLSMKDVSKVA